MQNKDLLKDTYIEEKLYIELLKHKRLELRDSTKEMYIFIL